MSSTQTNTIKHLHQEALNAYRASDYSRSFATLNKLFSVSPGNPAGQNILGLLMLKTGNYEFARKVFEGLAEKTPDNPDILANIGICCLNMGDGKNAVKAMKKSIEVGGAQREKEVQLANIYHRIGSNDEAMEILYRLIEEPDADAGVWYNYILTRLHMGHVTELTELLEKKQPSFEGSIKDQSSLMFALGEFYDKTQDYKQAIEYYQKGNDLTVKPNAPPTHEECQAIVEDAKSQFPVATYKQMPTSSNSSNKPIFIIGMPRSGTTLMEKIIAVTDGVAAGGELHTMPDIAKHMEQLMDKEGSAALNTDMLNKCAEEYLKKLDTIDASAKHVTDKMPFNFLYAGLIGLIFPQAKFIYTKRHVLDNALSCYFQQFSANHPFSADFSSLASYYRMHEDMMALWQEVLGDRLITVHYEELVDNFDAETKRIYAHIGLEWHEGVHKFHKKSTGEDFANTASYHQVSKKLYTSSKERWRNYEPYIQELISSLQREKVEIPGL